MSCFALNKHKINDGGYLSSQDSPNNKQHRSIFHAFGGRSSAPSSPALGRSAENQMVKNLKEEIRELSTQLTIVTQERDFLEKNVNEIQIDKLRLCREKDEKLESMSTHYEERLTELHSVIAELSRQLEQSSKERISEVEDEIDEDNHGGDSEKKKSLKRRRKKSLDAEEEGLKLELISRTSTDINAAAIEAGKRLLEGVSDDDDEGDGEDGGFFRRRDSMTSLQLTAIQEELSDARERNVQLTMRLREREAYLEEVRERLETVSREKENLRAFVNQMKPKSCGSRGESPRMAERKRIKKIEDPGAAKSSQTLKQNVGHDLSNVRNSVVVEHLVRDIQDKSSTMEYAHSFYPPFKIKNVESSPERRRQRRRRAKTEEDSKGGGMDDKMKEFEIEMDRLGSKIEHLKSQNMVLSNSLKESKSQCEHLTILIGKYESNCTAQKIVIDNEGEIQEGYEVLFALLETEMGVLLANCKATPGFEDLVRRTGNSKLITTEELVEQASENRHSAESLAKRLLNKVDNRPDSGLAGHSYLSHSVDSSSCQTSSISSNEGDAGVISDLESRSEETRIREYISRLKSQVSRIKSTLINEIESHCPPQTSLTDSNFEEYSRSLDLEVSVLFEELMAMREERADLRARVYILEREKNSMELLINAQQNQEDVLTTHIRHLEYELDKIRSEQERGVDDSNEQMSREISELRSRVAELLNTLEKVKRNSDLRQKQSNEIVSDLRRTNSSLSEALEKSKRKYQAKLKKLEQQILQAMLHSKFPLPCDENNQSISTTSETTDDQSD